MALQPTPEVLQVNWWFALAATAINATVLAALGAWGKSWLDEKLEGLRSSLRRNEEQVKALTQTVIAGEKVRVELIAKRRVEVIEDVWRGVQNERRFEFAPKFLQRVNLDEVRKVTSPDDVEKVKRWFGGMAKAIPPETEMGESVQCAKLYLSQATWNLYAAYVSSIVLSVVIFRGIEKTGPGCLEFIQFDTMRMQLVEALPGMDAFIEDHPQSAVFYLYEQLREELFVALTRELEGQPVHEQTIGRMVQMLGKTDAVWTQGATISPPPIPELVKQGPDITQLYRMPPKGRA